MSTMAPVSTKRALVLLALGGLVLAACSKTADPERQVEPSSASSTPTSTAAPTVSAASADPQATQPAVPKGAVPPYPGATEFCSGHLTSAPGSDAPGPHISWVAYATADPPSRVVMHYQAQIDPTSHAREGDQDIWRLPPVGPRQTVAVTAASQPGPWDRCDKPAKAAAVIMHSTVAQAD